jgi:hypothetical protein
VRPGIVTNTFLRPLFLGNVVHPPSFPDLQKTTPPTDCTAKDDAPNGSYRKRRRPKRILPQRPTPQTDRTAKDDAPNGSHRKRRRPKRIVPQKTRTPPTDYTAKADAPNGLHRKRRRPQRIILQKTTPLQTPPPKRAILALATAYASP